MMENCAICPSCGKPSLPKISDDSQATAVACQNLECGAVYDRNGHLEFTSNFESKE